MTDASQWVGVLDESPWTLVLLLVVTTIDGFFPPVPSESLLIALTALPTPHGRHLGLLGAVAALGAFTGDQVAYEIGHRVDLRRIRFLRSERAQQTLEWASKALNDRGAAFVIAGRFVPGGRVAVNMTAGAMNFPRRRFSALAAVAAVLWSMCSIALGVGASHVFAGRNPLLGAAVGVCAGILVGTAVDQVLRKPQGTHRRRPTALEPTPATAREGNSTQGGRSRVKRLGSSARSNARSG